MGSLEVIAGCMFSGKSEELIRRVKRALIARQQVKVFKPGIDDRYSATEVASHDGRTVKAVIISTTDQILDHVTPEDDVIAVDEAQFFDQSLVAIARLLVRQGKRVILVGLDTDFRGEPFGPMPELLAIADHADKLHAICVICGGIATRTQRLINGRPAHYSDPIVLVGAAEHYEARCNRCHEVVISQAAATAEKA